MRRAQALAALVLGVLLAGGAAYADRELGARAPEAAGPSEAPSGAWYCPHGGGKQDWEVELRVANPGGSAARIRVRTLGADRPTAPEMQVVDPGSSVTIAVPADGRERASMVEWFDQWVAVGWVSHAGGEEGGVAAEPCAPAAGDLWSLPDGTSETEENDDYLVVMNPFSRDAVFSVVLLSDRQEPVLFGELTDVTVRPFRSRVFRLDEVVDGERTVSSVVDVSVGRVAAATLGVVSTGGIRSSLGYLGDPPDRLIFPGGEDAGRTDLVVMSRAEERVGLAADLLVGDGQEQPFAGLADSAPPAQAGRTYPVTTAGPTAIAFTAEGPGVAAARRTFGVVSDQGSSLGAAPAATWVVLSAVSGDPSHPAIALANPGTEPAEVELSFLGPAASEPVSVTVPARSSVLAPAAFVETAPTGAVIARATSGTFVPLHASYARGREGFATYAAALGIPVPPRWVSSSTTGEASLS